MTLTIPSAEQILRRRFGEPVKRETQYVVGFKTQAGRVLALHREAGATRLWFLPPAPHKLDGVRLMPNSAKNSNLDGPLAPLNLPSALRIEVDSEAALQGFIDWYAEPGKGNQTGTVRLDVAAFRQAFVRLQRLIAANDKGRPFTNFQEGVAGAWENYKPHLREHALGILGAERWKEDDIGSGKILQHTIDAIEIQDKRGNYNNLVFWQNRFGHANRDHRVLLEAMSSASLRRQIELLLFGLYCGNADESTTFDDLSQLTGAKYPLLAYLFFVKDMDRFMPIQPTTFDRAFRGLGIDLVTLRHCSWDNYKRFNAALVEVQQALASTDGLSKARLIDAHSFCWLLEQLPDGDDPTGKLAVKDAGRILGGRERSIIAMRLSVENTVGSSFGQVVERTVKNKELRMSTEELEKLLAFLLELQGDCCALTGIPFQFHGSDADKNLRPSLDRIDSNGHYETGNLQIVCQFVNFWKGDSDDEEFKRLLMLVRGAAD